MKSYRNLKEILSELFKVGDEGPSPAFSVSYSFKKSFFRKVVCILIKSDLPMRDYHYPVCHAKKLLDVRTYEYDCPAFLLYGKNDAIFPYDSVKKLSDSVISEYESLGVPENFCSIMEDCAHDFRLKEQENALSFFSNHL